LLDECRTVSGGRDSTDNDRDIALHGIHDMTAFAKLGALDCSDAIIQKAAWELTGHSTTDLQVAAKHVALLAQTHAAEWADFCNQSAVNGFIHCNQEK
jgi:hypothetical protein